MQQYLEVHRALGCFNVPERAWRVKQPRSTRPCVRALQGEVTGTPLTTFPLRS